MVGYHIHHALAINYENIICWERLLLKLCNSLLLGEMFIAYIWAKLNKIYQNHINNIFDIAAKYFFSL